jgi:hypothetical protein
MKKLFSASFVLALALGAASFALGAGAADGTWSGYVTETHCGAAGAKAEHADCAVKCVKEKGAKWALYNTDDKSMFVLTGDDATMAKMAGMAGKKVTVKGSMDKDKKSIAVANMDAGS